MMDISKPRFVSESKIKHWPMIKLEYHLYGFLFDIAISASKKLLRSKFGQWFFFHVVSYFERKFQKLSRQMYGSITCQQ